MISVNSFDDMATALENLASRPDHFVIRGTLREDVEANIGDDVYATVMRRSKGPSDPFRPVNRRWIAIDFDAIPAPAGTDPGDAVEYLIGLLPPKFHDVSCSWQWTASQGFKPDTLNARFWFWLPFPVGDKELHRWAEHVNAEAGCKLIDPALFNPVQPHYTAGPIFDGMVPGQGSWPSLPDPALGLRPDAWGLFFGALFSSCWCLPPGPRPSGNWSRW